MSTHPPTHLYLVQRKAEIERDLAELAPALMAELQTVSELISAAATPTRKRQIIEEVVELLADHPNGLAKADIIRELSKGYPGSARPQLVRDSINYHLTRSGRLVTGKSEKIKLATK